jgi:hypothetical protein
MKHLPIFAVLETFGFFYLLCGGITVSDCVRVLTVYIKYTTSVHIIDIRRVVACYFFCRSERDPTIQEAKNGWNKRPRRNLPRLIII